MFGLDAVDKPEMEVRSQNSLGSLIDLKADLYLYSGGRCGSGFVYSFRCRLPVERTFTLLFRELVCSGDW